MLLHIFILFCISETAYSSYFCHTPYNGTIGHIAPDNRTIFSGCYPVTYNNRKSHAKTRKLYPQDCGDWFFYHGFKINGLYSIFPEGPPNAVIVYCDMTTDGGKWTVIQRRINGSVNFRRSWVDYRDGFGQATGEYWLGLKYLHSLTKHRAFELRIDLVDFADVNVFAKYRSFAISPFAINAEEDGYRLYVSCFLDGGAGDTLYYHHGHRFSTFDRDLDAHLGLHCADIFGAFWHRCCHLANLNGYYPTSRFITYPDGIIWFTWKGYRQSLKRVEMKIRPYEGNYS